LTPEHVEGTPSNVSNEERQGGFGWKKAPSLLFGEVQGKETPKRRKRKRRNRVLLERSVHPGGAAFSHASDSDNYPLDGPNDESREKFATLVRSTQTSLR